MSEAQSYQAGNIDKDRVVYLASDFDNVTRLFLDAAERCIASERREKELQQRLTAADELIDLLGGLLIEAQRSVDYHAGMQRQGDGERLYDLLARIKAAEVPAPQTCVWQYGAFSWHTGCGQEWMLNDGTPEQNGMHFCHSCGKTLVVADEGEGDDA